MLNKNRKKNIDVTICTKLNPCVVAFGNVSPENWNKMQVSQAVATIA